MYIFSAKSESKICKSLMGIYKKYCYEASMIFKGTLGLENKEIAECAFFLGLLYLGMG